MTKKLKRRGGTVSNLNHLQDECSLSLEEIREAIRSLAEKGSIVDTGLRRWSEETGQYEIVWIALRPPVVN
jgi:hypothetical protein